jgi:ABC-type multidrug transport system fused ATPase/permease subunit
MTQGKSDASLMGMMWELWEKIEGKNRRQIFQILFLMLLASFAEMLSIGAIFPFLGVLVDPDQLLRFSIVQVLLDKWQLTSTSQLLLPFSIIFCLITLAAAAIRLTLAFATTRYSNAIGAAISLDMYRRALYQPYLVHVSRNTSEVISGIVGKSGMVIGSVLTPLLQLISAIILFLGIFTAIMLISPGIALGAGVIFGFAYYLITRIVRHKLHKNSECISQESVRVMKSLQEGLGGIRDVLLDGTQEVYCNIYRKADYPLRLAYGSNSFLSSSPRFIIEALGMILIVALAYFLSKQGQAGGMAIPVLGALALGAQRLLPVLQQMYSSITTIRGAKSILRDTLGLLNQPLPSSLMGSTDNIPFSKSIQLTDIGFKYSSDSKPVLSDINLTITKGSRIGFMGATGSGKSTLLDIVMGLLEPTSGVLQVDGTLIDATNMSAWRSHIAHVPQSIYLTDATIAQNIAFGVDVISIDYERVKRAAGYAQLAKFIDELPAAYDTRVGERGVRLSGGQRQRIGIARALYKQADVLVFDEATSALDGNTENEVMEAINSLSKDLTVIMVAHRLTTLKSCNLVVEVAQGVIQRVGSYNDLIKL